MASANKRKKTKKTKKGMQTKISIVPADDISSQEDRDEDFDEGGMYLEKEELKIIYNALNSYKPTEKEDHLHSVLLSKSKKVL
jgi:hypothetical protein